MRFWAILAPMGLLAQLLLAVGVVTELKLALAAAIGVGALAVIAAKSTKAPLFGGSQAATVTLTPSDFERWAQATATAALHRRPHLDPMEGMTVLRWHRVARIHLIAPRLVVFISVVLCPFLWVTQTLPSWPEAMRGVLAGAMAAELATFMAMGRMLLRG